MGIIFYGCDECMEHDAECSVYHHDDLRLASDGKWICENCYDDAPAWTYNDRPANFNEDDDDYPRWSSLPKIPNYVPESR